MARKIIKGEAPVDPAAAHGAALGDRKVIDREVFAAQKRADEIRQEAERTAAQRRQEGASQAEEVYQKAYGAGGVSGTEQVAAAALAGYRGRVDRLMSAIDDCITIARKICNKVMGAPLQLDEASIRDIATEELRSTAARRQATIVLAADRASDLQQRGPKLWHEIEQQCFLACTTEAGQAADLCLVRTDVGDLSIDMEAAEHMLREVLQVGDEAPATASPEPQQTAAADPQPAAVDAEGVATPPVPAGASDVGDRVARVDAED